MSSFYTNRLKYLAKGTRPNLFYYLILPPNHDLHNWYLIAKILCVWGPIINSIKATGFVSAINNFPVSNRRINNHNTFHMRESKMLKSSQSGWSNRQVSTLRMFKNRLFEEEEQELACKIMLKEDNNMSFYQITPKEELPKSLQKMSFQTLNSKQNVIDSYVKVHRKQSLTKKQFNIRKLLRESGQIMLLSEIYNYLDDPLESQKIKQQKLRNQIAPLPAIINQLDEWEKVTSKKGTLEVRFSKLRLPNSPAEERRNSSHKKQFIAKKFKIGSDYKTEIEKSLEVINCSHRNQPNLMSRYLLIENSSKALKKQLEQMKEIVQKEIQEKMKKLAESRREHHRLYEEKLKLQIEEQQLDEEMARQEGNGIQNNGYGFHTLNQTNIKIVFEDKKNQIQKNEVKINKIKKNIEFLQEETLKNEEELKNIIVAETVYYKVSLKNGVDCRDSGLVWVIKNLGLQQCDIPNTEFPSYLDKRSKFYLVNKAKCEDKLEQILKEKRQFIKQIGKQNSESEKRTTVRTSISRKSSVKLEKPISKCEQDEIKQIVNTQCDSQIPKRYSRSMKKITALREEFLKNENLFKLTQSRGGFKFGYNLSGLTGKQIYDVIGEKIKQVDFTKLKKEKSQQKNDKIFQYQAILKRIEEFHMQIQEQDIQHESHLLSQFKDQKQLFFTLAAACFGVKRAYSLIIKNFSWKSAI